MSPKNSLDWADSEARRLAIEQAMINYPLISEWETAQRGQGLSDRTIEARVWRVAEFANFLDADPSTATTADLSRFMAMLSQRRNRRGEPLDKSSLATYHSHMKAWFAWLVTMEYRDDNPCARVKAARPDKREPRPVTDREVEAIFAVRVHKRTRMMLLLAAFQGLRCHEIAKMRGEDVNLLDRQLTVKGKGGKKATIKLHELVAIEARDFPAKGYWFPTHKKGNSATGTDGPILARSVSDMLGDVFERARVSGGAHRLRHWHATSLLAGGANMRLVQKLMRHKSIQSTELYTEVQEADQAEALARLKMPGSDDGQADAA